MDKEVGGGISRTEIAAGAAEGARAPAVPRMIRNRNRRVQVAPTRRRLFDKGAQAFLAGRFASLEDEMAGLSWSGDYEGPGRSPDRVDAMVWAMTVLMKPPRVYRIGFIGS